MNSKQREELLLKLQQGYRFPPLSPLATELISLAAEEDTTAADLKQVIEKDPAMTLRILNLANGFSLRSSYQVTTVERAVIKIGFERIRLMALSLTLRETFPFGKVDGMDYELFWKGSLYRAILARNLAVSVDGCNPEEAFVAALTLEIGFLLYHDLFFKKRKIGVPQGNIPLLLKMQTQKIGINHREVGDAALRYFGFPEKYIQCQLAYGESLTGKDMDPLVFVVNGAMELSGVMFAKGGDVINPVMRIKNLTGLSAAQINLIIADTFSGVHGIAKELDVRVNPNIDMFTLLEKVQHGIRVVKKKIHESKKIFHDKSQILMMTKGEKRKIEKSLLATWGKADKIVQHIKRFVEQISVSIDAFSDSGQFSTLLLAQAADIDQQLDKLYGSYRSILRL